MIRIITTFDCRFQKFDQSFKTYEFVKNYINGESRFYQIPTVSYRFLMFLNGAEFLKMQWINGKWNLM